MENRYKREVAVRCFSSELRQAEIMEREEGEFAPHYVLLPSGLKTNRVFIVGTLVDIEDIGKDEAFWRLRISDPNGTFEANVGMYSPILAQTTVENMEPPMFVAVVGKVKGRDYEDKQYFSIAVESITEVDVDTYDHWVEDTERLTAERQDGK